VVEEDVVLGLKLPVLDQKAQVHGELPFSMT
jgi:hypothetical protein